MKYLFKQLIHPLMIIGVLFVLSVLAGITYILANHYETRYLQVMFYVGLVSTLVIYFFSSKGGVSQQREDLMARSGMNISTYDPKLFSYSLNINPFFVGSIVFFVGSIVLATFYY